MKALLLSLTAALVYLATSAEAASPAITVQPQSRTNNIGTTATFSVTATGTAPLSYQWVFNDGLLAGRTNSTLTLSNVQPSDSGAYVAVVTNRSGSVTSAVAVLTVCSPPVMNCPTDIIVPGSGPAGAVVMYTVTATANCDRNVLIVCM